MRFKVLGLGLLAFGGLAACGGQQPVSGNADLEEVATGVDHDAMAMDEMDPDAMAMDGMAMVPPVIALPAAEGPFEVAPAADLDPAANVVEVELVARESEVVLAPGKPATKMWTYNGQLPGPRIEAKVGDTVRIRFTNSLPEATTIHWHGIRVPAAMDGVAAMQTPVAPGGSFTYEFVVPDAGTFWYHPHIRSDVQVERGLYGAFVVRGATEPEVTSERVVVLDDVLVDDDFQLAPAAVEQAMVGHAERGMMGQLMVEAP